MSSPLTSDHAPTDASPFTSADWEPDLATETWETPPHTRADLTRLEGPTILVVGKHFYRTPTGHLLKAGGREDEARMMALARRVLSGVVTVPAVHAVVHTPNGDAILMDYVQGVPLSTIWSGLSALQRATVKHKLCDVLCAMRRPSFGYAGRLGRRPYVLLFEFGVAIHDLCTDVQMWNESRARAVSKNVGDARRAGALREKQFELVTAARFVLTHGDLSDRNILVDPDTLDIVGVLDWEYANVVPSYFEYVAARLSGGHRPYWRAELLEVLEKVLERECGEARRVEGELARWKALVDVERYAQGYDDDCAWTFETDSLETPICE